MNKYEFELYKYKNRKPIFITILSDFLLSIAFVSFLDSLHPHFSLFRNRNSFIYSTETVAYSAEVTKQREGQGRAKESGLLVFVRL